MNGSLLWCMWFSESPVERGSLDGLLNGSLNRGWCGKFMSRSSRKLCKGAALKKKTTALLEEKDLEPEHFISLLLTKNSYEECLAFLAVALPPRESVYWAICCFDSIPRPGGESAEEVLDNEINISHAFASARAWVNQPVESTRRHAGKMARLAGLKTAEGWLAQAVFWSGGSILSPDKPFIAPPEGVYSKAINSALKLLMGRSIMNMPREVRERVKPVMRMSFIKAGLSVARGASVK